MNLENIFSQIDKSESFVALVFLLAAFVLGMIFVWIWLGGKIKDARKALEEEQLKNSALMGKNEELENEAKIHLADVNRIKIENRDLAEQHNTSLQEKDRLYSQVIMLSESEALLKDELDDVNSRYTIMESSQQKMSSSLTQISSDFETSVAQKDSLHSRVAELEAANQDLIETRTRENASYTTQLGSLQETLNHLQAEHTIAQNDLAAKTEEFNSFRSKYLMMKNEHGALSSSHENMVSDLEAKTAKLTNQQDMIKSLLVKQNQYIVDLEAAKEEMNSFKSVASTSKDKEIAAVYNAQILSLQEALETATDNLATLEAEKENTNEELAKLRQKANSEVTAEVNSDDRNPSYSSFDDTNDTSLSVELNVIKKQLEKEQQARIDQQQEADRWRASLITMKADLAQAEEDRAQEQENFLNELAELKDNHREMLELEAQKLEEATVKVEELEAKVTWLEAISNDAENDVIHLETSQGNVLDIENDKLSTARDENMQLQSQVNSLLSKIRELQASSEEVGLMGDSAQEELIEGLEAQAVQLGAIANDAENDIIELEEKYTRILNIENDKLSAAKNKIDALNLQIDRAEAKLTNLEATLNDVENDNIELEEKYAKILNIENDKFSAAKDNIFNLETQIGLLETKVIRLEAMANDAENDYIEHEAKLERLLDIEQAKLSASKDANMSLMEQLAEFKLKAAGSIAVTNENKVVDTIAPSAEVNTNTRTDANLEDNAMDSNQATKALKKLIGNKIPATSSQKDNLQVIKGIGPRIEEKLNQLGLNSYHQISSLTKDQIQMIRTALDIFPGRIEQDNWVKQAKELYEENKELTPASAKVAIQNLIGNRIPKASAKNKDDLKLIKGVGGFLEKKLNDIGIYTFEQISKFDNDIIENVTVAIEFFPGRIKRDKWVKQSKELM